MSLQVVLGYKSRVEKSNRDHTSSQSQDAYFCLTCRKGLPTPGLEYVLFFKFVWTQNNSGAQLSTSLRILGQMENNSLNVKKQSSEEKWLKGDFVWFIQISVFYIYLLIFNFDFILGGLQNHCRWWLQQWNWKTLTPWKESYDQSRQHIKKQRHHFANKGPSSQGYAFSSSHVWMWEFDYKESWAPKN